MRLNRQILDEISRQINSISFHKTELYKLLKKELTNTNHWQNKPRGNPPKGFKTMQSKLNKQSND